MQPQVVTRFTISEKDENRKVILREHWVILQTNTGSRIAQVEKVEDFREAGAPPEPEVQEAHVPRLIISDMTKGEFRLAIYRAVGAGVDKEKADKALQKTNADSRRQFGGLKYDRERVNFALEIYKKL